MATLEQRTHARSFLKKAEEYLASAEANFSAIPHGSPRVGNGPPGVPALRCPPASHVGRYGVPWRRLPMDAHLDALTGSRDQAAPG